MRIKRMTKRILKFISSKNGRLPVCSRCGKVLERGTKVVSKVGWYRTKRFCYDCAKALKII